MLSHGEKVIVSFSNNNRTHDEFFYVTYKVI